MIRIRSILISTFLLLPVVSCKPDIGFATDAPDSPSVELEPVVADSTCAVLTASVSHPELISRCGFGVGPVNTDTDALARIVASIGPDGRFSSEITGLSPETEYVFYAYAGNGVSEIMSSRSRFVTLKGNVSPVDTSHTNIPVDTTHSNPPVPPVPPTPSVDSTMEQRFPDPVLRDFVLWYFDKDEDGNLSESEMLQVTRLEMTNNKIENTHGLEYFPNLAILALNGERNDDNLPSNGKITSIDLSHNPKLEELYLDYQNVSDLDLSGNPELRDLGLYKNPLETLDLSANTKLVLFGAGFCHLKHIDLTHNTKLDEVHLDNNELESVELGYNPSLRYLCLENNRLTTLDITGCHFLSELGITGNPDLKTVYMQEGHVFGSLMYDDGVEFIPVE